MKYLKLILAGYKRLMLKNIQYFEINPSDPVQLILGTNGSGKSSIMNELSPLPANASDFAKDGYKEIHVEFNGELYILKSVFEPKQRHSILKDGIELNDGGTGTAQKELIKRIFSITPDIHELITGRVKFTQMTSPDRRYWFTELSNTNYDYVIKVYNKLQTKYRDITGTIKTLKKRLVAETEKIVDIDYQSTLEKEVDDLHKFLSHLLEIRKPLDETPEELRRFEDDLYRSIAALSITLIKTIKSTPLLGSMSIEQIDSDITECVSIQRSCELLTDTYMVEIKKLDETISILEQTSKSSVDELMANILRYQIKQKELKDQLTIDIEDGIDCDQIISALASIDPTILEISTTLASNSDKIYSRANYNNLKQTIITLNEVNRKLENDLNELQARKKHQELHRDSDELQCPKCAFKWHLGYSENTYQSILKQIDDKAKELTKVSEEIKLTQDKIQELLDYFQIFNKYTSISNNWPILKSLWDWILSTNVIFDNPSNLNNLVNDYTRIVLIKKEHDGYIKSINDAQKLITLSEQVGNSDIGKVKAHRVLVEENLSAVTSKISAAKLRQKELVKLKSDKLSVDSITNNLKTLLEQSTDIHDRTKEALRRQIFNDCIRTIQTTLSRKELAISEIRSQRNIIVDIQHQIGFLESDEKALKILVEQLSPVDGLIAEGMFGFIEVFVSQMNTFISQVWSYPLEIQTCNLEEGGEKVELDYKFPVKTNPSLSATPDISKASVGQKEIIDLAFMVLAMKHLGLGKAPIMLDEFAANLDNTHRIAAIQTVKSLIEEHSFTQLFMVNHYESIYGAFTNAQITVLCDENILIPRDCIYNRHVTIR